MYVYARNAVTFLSVLYSYDITHMLNTYSDDDGYCLVFMYRVEWLAVSLHDESEREYSKLIFFWLRRNKRICF